MAQDTSPFELTLEELQNVRVVAAGRREQCPFDSPRSISVITADDLRRRNYRSTPEALQEVAGVLVQQTNDGGGAPILRGLIGNQVLLLVDGIRLNNAIYRLGPNQYLNTIDINQIERIEVIRGPGSVLFGSDALGGTINIVTKSRVIGDAKPSAFQVSTRASSADRGIAGRAAFEGGTSRLSAVGGVSLKSFGQIRAGSQTLQAHTGYDEWAADMKVGVSVRPGHTLTFSGQHVAQSDVQRTDALVAGTDVEYRWDPEARTLVSAQYATTKPIGFIRDISAFTAYQTQEEHVVRRTAPRPSTRRLLHDHDQGMSAGVQFYSTGGRHSVTYGSDLYADWVLSQRTDEAMATGVRTPQRGTFADGARTWALSTYVQDRIDLTSRVGVELGGRFAGQTLTAALRDDATGEVAVNNRNKPVTGSAYGFVALAEPLRLVGGVSQGFRAPNVDDVSILGSFGGGFEVPNPLLKPEHSINTVIGLKYSGRAAVANISLFDVRYRDLITRAPATFGGLSFLDTNGNRVREAVEPLVFRRQNIGQARVKGIELDGQLHMAERWRIGGSFGWTDGRDETAGEPLRRLPPVHGTASVAFEPSPRWWVEAFSLYSDDQRRLNSADIVDVRIGPAGTPGFATVNLRGGVHMAWLGTVTAGLENLTDTRYKWHGSGVYRPGRSVVVGLRREL